jgi:hypothetical protein
MAKKQKLKNIFLNKYKISVIIVTALITFIVICIFNFARNYQWTIEALSASEIRQQVLEGVSSTKHVAPIDAKTGDTYFPEAKLFVPYAKDVWGITYEYSENNASSKDTSILSISSVQTFQEVKAATNISGVFTTEQVFERLPNIQACQRGIDLTYTKDGQEDTKVLKTTITLNNGKVLYMFVEKNCKFTDKLEKALENIQTY